MKEVVDVLGVPVNPGDRVAGAFRSSNRAILRVGEVISFGERGNRLTVNVRWVRESAEGAGLNVDIVGGIEAELFRFVKIQ